MTYVVALLVVIAAAAFEGLCAGRDPMAQLKALKQRRQPPSTDGRSLATGSNAASGK
jgi:hypothetical protein